jgi:hypothetical protein
MLIADILPDFDERLELCATYLPEVEWVTAERRDVAGATRDLGRTYGINIDSTLLLDFDSAGYLEAAEIIGKRSAFEEYDVVIPQSYRKAALRLSSIPDDPQALDDESPVTVYANGARTLILAVVPQFGERSSWFALGQTVYVAVDDGRLSAMLFVLCT